MVAEALDHNEVLAAGKAAAQQLKLLFERVLVDPALTV